MRPEFTFLLTTLALTGCTSFGGESGTPITLSGTYVVENDCDPSSKECKTAIEPNSRIVVVWSLGDGGMYVAGEGVAGDGVWTVTLPPTLPVGALYGGVIGVGMLVVEDTSHPWALAFEEGPGHWREGVVQGRSIDVAIIWRDGAVFDWPDGSWMGVFGQGYRCGMCVETEEVHDAYEEIPCDALQLNFSLGTTCNWT